MAWIDEHFARYRDYPIEVVIETTGKCNARCVFCPHSEMARKGRDMPEEVFLEIVRQLEQIPKTHPFYVTPFKVNELLLDKRIFQRIEIINQRVPHAFIRLFSNFSLAKQPHFEKICAIRNLSDIDISLNSLDAGEYEALMGLRLARTLGNVLDFLQYIRAHGIRMQKRRIVLSRVSQSAESDERYLEEFARIFAEYLDIVEPQIIPLGEWIDYLPSGQPARQQQPCARWANVEICCTGEVALCCMDGKCEYPLGDVWENTLLEIYNQPAYKRLRTKGLHKAQVIPCKSCSQ